MQPIKSIVQKAPWRLQTEVDAKPSAGVGLAKTVQKSGIQFRGSYLTPIEKEYLRRLTEEPRFTELHEIVWQEIQLLLPAPADADRAGGGQRAASREMLGHLLEMWLRDLARLALEVWEVERTNSRATAAKDHITRLEQEKVHAHRTYMQELTALRDQLRCLERKTPVNFSMSIDDIYFYEPTKYFEDNLREFVKEIVTYKVRQTLSTVTDEEAENAQAPEAKLVTTIKEREEEITELKEMIRDMEYTAAQDAKQRERRGSVEMELQWRKHDNDKKDRFEARPQSRKDRARLASGGSCGGLCRQCGGAVDGGEEEQQGGDSVPASPSGGGAFEGGLRAGSLRRGHRMGTGGHGTSTRGEDKGPESPSRRNSVNASTQADGTSYSSRHGSKARNRNGSKQGAGGDGAAGGAGGVGGPAPLPPWGGGGKPKQMLRLLAEIAEAKGLVRELREAASQASSSHAKVLEKQAKEQEKRVRELQAKLDAEYGDLSHFIPEVADCGTNTLPNSAYGGGGGGEGNSPGRPGSRASSPGKRGSLMTGGGSPGGGGALGGLGVEAPALSRSPSRRTSGGPSDLSPRQRSSSKHGSVMDYSNVTSRLSQGGQEYARRSLASQHGRTPRSHEDGMYGIMEEAMLLSEELLLRHGHLETLAEEGSDMGEAVFGMGGVVHKLSSRLGAVRDGLSSLPAKAAAEGAGGGESPTAAGTGQRFQELKNQLYDMTEKFTQAEFAISELHLKLKEMQQKLRDAGLGEVAEKIMDAVGLRQIASVAAARSNTVCVFDRLYKDALTRIQRIGDPTDPNSRGQALGRTRLLRQMRQPLQMARRAEGMEEDRDYSDEPFDGVGGFFCPHCQMPLDDRPSSSASSRPVSRQPTLQVDPVLSRRASSTYGLESSRAAMSRQQTPFAEASRPHSRRQSMQGLPEQLGLQVRASPQDSRLQTPSGAQVRPTPQGLQVPGVQSRPGTRCPLDLQAQSVAQAPLDVHVQGLPIARTLSQGPPVPLPSAQPLSGRSTPGQLPGHSPRARVPSPSGQGHSPQPLLVAAGQQMIPPQTPLAVARQQAQTPVAQTPQTPLAAARQQAQTPQTPLLAAERARAQTPQTAAELQAQAPPAQTPQTPLAAARQQAQAPTAQTPQTPALDAGQQAQASPAQTPLVDARQQATPQQAQQTTGASPAEAEAAEAAQGQGRGASRRGVRASLVRQDATDWMDPGPGRASLGLGLSRPSGEPPGRTPNRPRDPLWSPRPLPSPELPLNHSVSDSALTPRDSTQTQTTWSYASVSTAGASLSTGASAPLLPTSAPVMGPKRSSLAAPARQQRLASPRGSVSERPPSRSSLPPVQDPAAAKAPARGGAAEPQRRPPPSAEGEGLRHAASAPALTQAAVRGHEAELLPPLERPPSTGSGVGVRAHRGDGHAADVASPFKPGAAAALLPLGGRPPSPGRLGVDEEFVSLSGDTIFILKPAGHNKKKTPFEDYTVARFIGGQHRPKLVVGGQAFS